MSGDLDPTKYGSMERVIVLALLPLVPLAILWAYFYFVDPHQGHHQWTCRRYHVVVADCPLFDEYVYPCDVTICDEWDATGADLSR